MNSGSLTLWIKRQHHTKRLRKWVAGQYPMHHPLKCCGYIHRSEWREFELKSPQNCQKCDQVPTNIIHYYFPVALKQIQSREIFTSVQYATNLFYFWKQLSILISQSDLKNGIRRKNAAFRCSLLKLPQRRTKQRKPGMVCQRRAFFEPSLLQFHTACSHTTRAVVDWLIFCQSNCMICQYIETPDDL